VCLFAANQVPVALRHKRSRAVIHTIVLAGSKGGIGKSTISSALAVRAAKESQRVAMLDLDPQGSLGSWWLRRGSVVNPRIFSGVETIAEAIDLLDKDGWEYLIVDTPPAIFATIEPAIARSDLVVIPCRASAFDLEGIDPVTEIARNLKRPYLVVLNDAEPRWKLSQTARQYLDAEGHAAAKTVICHRQAYVAAPTVGKTGPEVERDGKAGAEIDALWAEVKAHLAVARLEAGMRHGR
jgi:chromosome partitioning protein